MASDRTWGSYLVSVYCSQAEHYQSAQARLLSEVLLLDFPHYVLSIPEHSVHKKKLLTSLEVKSLEDWSSRPFTSELFLSTDHSVALHFLLVKLSIVCCARGSAAGHTMMLAVESYSPCEQLHSSISPLLLICYIYLV